MIINHHGYDESCWGSLAQWQTLHAPDRASRQRYSGMESLGWHPYEYLPRMPLDERYQSFAERLAKAQEKRATH